MTRVVALLALLALIMGCATERESQKRSAAMAEGVLAEDREVLRAALLSLLKNEGFGYPRGREGRTNIILISSSPENFGIAQRHQVEMDTRRKMPVEEFESFEARNRIAGTYDTVRASYTNFTMGPPIFIYDNGERFSDLRFSEAFPDARGWLQPYLPGYSRDGKRALVRGWMGPWAHDATYTALLKKGEDGVWRVVWEKIAKYA